MSDNLLFEKQTQSLVDNQEWRIGMAGDFFRLTDTFYPVTVSIVKENRIIGSMVNMQSGDYVRDIEFDAVIVKNGNNAQTVTVQIAGGGAGSDRIVGEVSVINGEVVRVKAGKCFTGWVNNSPGAGNFGHVQLRNASAVKNIILNKLSIYAAQQCGFALVTSNAQLAQIAPQQAISKLIGSVMPSYSEIRYENVPAVIAGNSTISSISYPTTLQSIEIPFSEPIVIGPLSAVHIYCNVANAVFHPTFHWNEE